MFTGGMWLWTYAFTYHLVPPEGMLLNKVVRFAGVCVSPRAVKASSGIFLPVLTVNNVSCLPKPVLWLIIESILHVPIFSIIKLYLVHGMLWCCLEGYFGNVFIKYLFVCIKILGSGEVNCSSQCLSMASRIDFSHTVWVSVTENKDDLGACSMTLGRFDRFSRIHIKL